MDVITGTDIDRNLTLREMIDLLIIDTDWVKYESMMVELDEDDYAVQIIVIKKGGSSGDEPKKTG